MKKIILATLISSLVFAKAHAYEDYGFYAGIDATATFWEMAADTDFIPEFSAVDLSAHHDDWDYSAMGRLGGYVTYGEDDRWLSAIEIIAVPNDIYFIDVTHINSGANDGDVQQQKLEATYTLGGQFKQGFIFDEDILAFMTAGLVYTQYKVTTTAAYTPLGNDPRLFISETEKFYAPGFRLAAGGEYLLNENLGIGAQVAYTWYEEKELSLTAQSTSSSSSTPYFTGTAGHVHFNSSALQVGAGFNFYFQ